MLRGSVTGAAQSLKVSQPVVSRLIRDRRSALAPSCLSTEDNHLVPTPEARLLLVEVDRFAYGRDGLPSAFNDVPMVSEPFNRQQLLDALGQLI